MWIYLNREPFNISRILAALIGQRVSLRRSTNMECSLSCVSSEKLTKLEGMIENLGIKELIFVENIICLKMRKNNFRWLMIINILIFNEFYTKNSWILSRIVFIYIN